MNSKWKMLSLMNFDELNLKIKIAKAERSLATIRGEMKKASKHQKNLTRLYNLRRKVQEAKRRGELHEKDSSATS